MNIHDSTLAASLDMSLVHELAQLSEEAFWNYAHAVCKQEEQKLAGTGPATSEQSPAKKVEEYLECVTGKGRFLLSLAVLCEIMPPPRRYTDLPDKPVWMSGLATWHGSAIVVVDLTLYLTGEAVPVHEHLLPASLLIAHVDDVSLGLLVHSNGAIISTGDIQPIPFDDARFLDTTGLYEPARHSVIAGMYEDAIVLNVPALLTDIVRQIEIAATHG